jgi:hypothetical protein
MIGAQGILKLKPNKDGSFNAYTRLEFITAIDIVPDDHNLLGYVALIHLVGGAAIETTEDQGRELMGLFDKAMSQAQFMGGLVDPSAVNFIKK